MYPCGRCLLEVVIPCIDSVKFHLFWQVVLVFMIEVSGLADGEEGWLYAPDT